MTLRSFLSALVASTAFILGASANAAVLKVTDGILTGANNVLVDGVAYDVSFTDGTCASVFNGCSAANFTFATYQQASLAANALFSQVFLDNGQGNFNTNPGKTAGCTLMTECHIYIPVDVSDQLITAAVALNAASFNIVTGSNLGAPMDTSEFNYITYARWTLAAGPNGDVPEPGSAALFGIASAGLALLRRRKPLAVA